MLDLRLLKNISILGLFIVHLNVVIDNLYHKIAQKLHLHSIRINQYLLHILTIFTPISCYRLTEDDIGEESVIQLHYVKYQNVQNITVSTIKQINSCLVPCVLLLFAQI